MDVRQLVGGRPTGLQAQQIMFGQVSQNQPAPASFNDPVFVLVPAISMETPYGPLSWPATHGRTLPGPGDSMVLALDERGVVHVIAWDGAYS